MGQRSPTGPVIESLRLSTQNCHSTLMFLLNSADASDVSRLFCMCGTVHTHVTQDMTEATEDEALVLQVLQIDAPKKLD